MGDDLFGPHVFQTHVTSTCVKEGVHDVVLFNLHKGQYLLASVPLTGFIGGGSFSSLWEGLAK
ncbi:MAG TPA: hypothetical protein VE130_09965 [Nitrososphaeraceae archaeon]|nr:hypothetical protein [Nitrososphaeraceae archaeon]